MIRQSLLLVLLVGVVVVWLISEKRRQHPVAAPAPVEGARRTVELPSWGNGAPPLLIDVPAAAKQERTQGPDFEVFYFAEPGGARLGIYLGHHPNSFQPAGARQEKGTIAGRQVTWTCGRDPETTPARELCETHIEGLFIPPPNLRKLPVTGGVQALVVHVWATGDPAAILRLRRSAQSLRAKWPAARL